MLSVLNFRETRYDAMRICIGEEACQKLAKLKLFMVGKLLIYSQGVCLSIILDGLWSSGLLKMSIVLFL